MSIATAGQVLIQDPCHPYAPELVRCLKQEHGLGVIFFHTDLDQFRRAQVDYPPPAGDSVVANYHVDLPDLDRFADFVRQHYEVVGVVPITEPAVVPASRLAQSLGLSWAQPIVLDRFRDKSALKDHLRACPDGPRVNWTTRVTGRDDVLRALGETDFSRFVLKPNDGYGNSRIGFLSRDRIDTNLDDYLGTVTGVPLILEEYVGGEEYYVNGQIDGEGVVTVVEVTQHIRGSANGRENVAFGSRVITTGEPEFGLLADYAVEVMQATGLLRSPFHLEVKIDGRGPCLLEVGARFVGGNRAWDANLLHGALDVFSIAVHYYVTGAPRGPLELDWAHYDRTPLTHVAGVSTEHGRIRCLDGVREVEALPEFVRWAHEPHVGDRLVPTVDIFQQPWRAVLRPQGDRPVAAAADQVRDLVRWNRDAGLKRLLHRMRSYGPVLRRKYLQMTAVRRLRPPLLPPVVGATTRRADRRVR